MEFFAHAFFIALGIGSALVVIGFAALVLLALVALVTVWLQSKL